MSSCFSRQDFGLCLLREYTSTADALHYQICDNRTVASFLCENDDLDFAIKTFLNKTFLDENLESMTGVVEVKQLWKEVISKPDSLPAGWGKIWNRSPRKIM